MTPTQKFYVGDVFEFSSCPGERFKVTKTYDKPGYYDLICIKSGHRQGQTYTNVNIISSAYTTNLISRATLESAYNESTLED